VRQKARRASQPTVSGRPTSTDALGDYRHLQSLTAPLARSRQASSRCRRGYAARRSSPCRTARQYCYPNVCVDTVTTAFAAKPG